MSAAAKSQPGLAPDVLEPIRDIDPDSLALLRVAPYDRPTKTRSAYEVKIAQRLVADGFLERDPMERSVVRCTEAGARAALPISLTRARLHVQAVRVAVEDGDDERAASLERALHGRVLSEVVLGTPSARELARIAHTTTAIKFTRR